MPGFVIDQHFTERKRLPRLKGVINAHREYVGLGIDEATAVIVRDGRILRFLGEGTVTVVLAKSSTKDEVVQVISAKSPGGLDAFQLLRAAAYRARKTPFPPENPAVPEVKNGSLVIVGGGGAGPEIWKTFIEKAGGNDKLIVVVTSAMEDPVPTNPVEVVLLKRYGATNVKILHTRDRAKANTDEFSAILKEAHGVWFSGGRQWRFVDSYAGTLTETRFKEVLDRGGVIGGSSAGASIQSEYMPRGHPLGNTVMAAEGYEQGFGYLPGCAVDQHFFARKRTEDMTSLMKMYPQLLGIGIDEGTAIVVTGTEAKVIGRTQVAFYDYRTPPKAGSPDYVTVKAGGVYDLKERKAK
jgi:cyanophycinase